MLLISSENHIPAKCHKNQSAKKFFLGKDFTRSLNFLFSFQNEKV